MNVITHLQWHVDLQQRILLSKHLQLLLLQVQKTSLAKMLHFLNVNRSSSAEIAHCFVAVTIVMEQ